MQRMGREKIVYGSDGERSLVLLKKKVVQLV